MDFAYPFNITKQDEEYIVTFPDIPEAITGAETINEARALARDALIAALGAYIEDRRDIPEPSLRSGRQERAYLRPLESAKAALYIAMRKERMSNVGLAAKLHIDEKAVRRMLDLDQNTKIDTIDAALRSVFNCHLVSSIEQVQVA